MKIAKLDLWAGILVTVIWGCNFSVIELGLKSLDPYLLTFFRFTFCALPAVFFIKKPSDVPYKYLFLYGVVFGVGLWWVVNLAMYNGLSAGLSSVFLQFSAFFTIILSSVFLKEKITSAHYAGMAFSIIGLAMILFLSDEGSTLVGIGLVLVSAISWSVCNLIVKIKRPKDMVAFIVWSSLFSAPAILIMTVATQGLEPFTTVFSTLSWAAGFSILFQAYVTTIFGYMVWNNLIKKYPASAVAPLSLLVPLSGMLTSFVFFDERLDALQGLAIGLVFVGIAVFINSGRIQLALDSRKLRS